MTASTRFLSNQMTIMKKIFVFAILAAVIGFFSASCEKAEVLEPTNIEKDWTKNIDLSNPYVKEIFEQTGVAILTEFDDTLDVFYQGADYGVLKGVTLTHVAPADKDKAIEWLKTNILDCFSKECMKKYFPRRIFLCNTLLLGSEPGFMGTYMCELRWTNNYWGLEGNQHAFAFKQGMAICVNVETLYNPDTQIDYNKQYREDIMHIICSELFMQHNWMAGIKDSEDIFPETVTSLYALPVLDYRQVNSLDGQYHVTTKGMYRTRWGVSAKDSRRGDPVTKIDWRYMSLEGYFEFGFPDNGLNNGCYSSRFSWGPPSSPITSTYNDDGERITYTPDNYCIISDTSQGANYTMSPEGSYVDARNLICALTDLNETKLSVYGEFLIHRLWSMSEYLRGYGIDFRKFDPDVVTMYQMHDEN